MPNSISLKYIRILTNVALILSLTVVMLGAYTRLTDAGLGCPDWPGCYGHLVLPDSSKALQSAQASYPDAPIDSRKAWTEMIHRYAAGTLMSLILIITGYAVKKRRKPAFKSFWLWAVGLTLLTIFQALLGMWTVTLKLLPLVVMSHLLGGILIFSIICRLRFLLSEKIIEKKVPTLGPSWLFWVWLGVVIVFCQIALGGWVSANYAGIACIGFPQCNGEWIPSLHFSQGLNLFSQVGENYQGGLLENEVRVTIQWIHRLGALLTASYLVVLSVFLLKKSSIQLLRYLGALIIALILLQVLLGILNVLFFLPIGIAVLHNGIAAILMAALLSTASLVRKKP